MRSGPEIELASETLSEPFHYVYLTCSVAFLLSLGTNYVVQSNATHSPLAPTFRHLPTLPKL